MANAHASSGRGVVFGIASIVPPHTLVRRPPRSHAGSGISFIFPDICGSSFCQTSHIQSGKKKHAARPRSFNAFPLMLKSGTSAAILSGPTHHDTIPASSTAFRSLSTVARPIPSKNAPPPCSISRSILLSSEGQNASGYVSGSPSPSRSAISGRISRAKSAHVSIRLTSIPARSTRSARYPSMTGCTSCGMPKIRPRDVHGFSEGGLICPSTPSCSSRSVRSVNPIAPTGPVNARPAIERSTSMRSAVSIPA